MRITFIINIFQKRMFLNLTIKSQQKYKTTIILNAGDGTVTLDLLCKYMNRLRFTDQTGSMYQTLRSLFYNSIWNTLRQ